MTPSQGGGNKKVKIIHVKMKNNCVCRKQTEGEFAGSWMGGGGDSLVPPLKIINFIEKGNQLGRLGRVTPAKLPLF